MGSVDYSLVSGIEISAGIVFLMFFLVFIITCGLLYMFYKFIVLDISTTIYVYFLIGAIFFWVVTLSFIVSLLGLKKQSCPGFVIDYNPIWYNVGGVLFVWLFFLIIFACKVKIQNVDIIAMIVLSIVFVVSGIVMITTTLNNFEKNNVGGDNPSISSNVLVPTGLYSLFVGLKYYKDKKILKVKDDNNYDENREIYKSKKTSSYSENVGFFGKVLPYGIYLLVLYPLSVASYLNIYYQSQLFAVC